MSSKVIFIIFIFAINFNAIFGQLSCEYDVDFNGYTCDLFINNPTGLNNFSSISGIHVSGYTDSDVFRIEVISGSISTNIPSIICSKFTNIDAILLESIGIEKVDDYSFNNCTKVMYMSLFDNQISTVHERAFNGNLNLYSLNLKNNHLTTLPENVFQFQQSLNNLWIDLNRLIDLPDKIFWPLTNLRALDLLSNQLQNIRSEWFENLQNLTFLSISNNFITDFPKNAFSQLKNLNTFYAFANGVKIIHADSFGFLPNLKTIYIWYNPVNAIDENLIDYTGITDFNMYGNICANKEISDTSISRDIMRAELRECFNNYERTMAVCRQHSKLFIESDKAQTCTAEKQVIQEMKETWRKQNEEMKEAWSREKEELLATIKQLSTNKQRP